MSGGAPRRRETAPDGACPGCAPSSFRGRRFERGLRAGLMTGGRGRPRMVGGLSNAAWTLSGGDLLASIGTAGAIRDRAAGGVRSPTRRHRLHATRRQPEVGADQVEKQPAGTAEREHQDRGGESTAQQFRSRSPARRHNRGIDWHLEPHQRGRVPEDRRPRRRPGAPHHEVPPGRAVATIDGAPIRQAEATLDPPMPATNRSSSIPVAVKDTTCAVMSAVKARRGRRAWARGDPLRGGTGAVWARLAAYARPENPDDA